MLYIALSALALYYPAPHTQLQLRIGRTLHPRGAVSSPVAAVSETAETGGKYIIGPVNAGTCAGAYLEDHPDLALPRMNVLAKQPPLTDEAIEEFLSFIGETLDHGKPFSVLWNVQGGAFPSMKQFRRVIQYLEEDNRSEKWDELVQGNVAIIRSPILRGAAKLMTAISNPPQPSFICNDEEKALNFAKEKLHEAKDWAH